MVATGTASNALALSLMASPISAIFCRSGAHLQNSEAGVPLMYTGGARIVGIDGRNGLIDPGDLDRALAGFDPTHMLCNPAVVSVTQASELGTVYSLQHLREISSVCRRHGLRMHMDGARFANGSAGLSVLPPWGGCHPTGHWLRYQASGCRFLYRRDRPRARRLRRAGRAPTSRDPYGH